MQEVVLRVRVIAPAVPYLLFQTFVVLAELAIVTFHFHLLCLSLPFSVIVLRFSCGKFIQLSPAVVQVFVDFTLD